MSCRGKTALVTHAAGNAGRAAVMALAGAGARVLVHDAQSPGNVEAIVAAVLSSGGIAKAAAADLATAEGSRQLAQEARAVIGDRLDILVLDLGARNTAASWLLLELLLPILNSGSRVIVVQPRHAAAATAREMRRLAGFLALRGVHMSAIDGHHERADDSRSVVAAISSLAAGERVS